MPARSRNSTGNQDSRYVQGGETDRYPTRLGWWERRLFNKRNDDIVVTIQTNEARRPELVANRVYGKATYAWLVLQYNNIVDINTEFLPGVELRLPNERRVALGIMTNPTGGVRVK